MRASRVWLAVVLSGTWLLPAGPAAAADDFYKDKTVHVIVGYSAGGAFDTYSRLIARHLGKHLPGQPTVVVQNMPGAGGLVLANHLYARVKPDGLTIGAWAAPLVLQSVMGLEAAKFDARKVGWLGVPNAYDTVCFLSDASGVRSMADWLAAKRPVKIAALGPGTSTSDVPKLAHAALGLPMQVVEGYKGGAEARLAVESGEAEGYCGSWQSMKTVGRSAFESGKFRSVLQLTLKGHPELKDVPIAITYAKTPEARQLLAVADSAHRGQFPYSVPPGVPADRLQLLQEAFMKTLRDPELLAEAERAKLEIDPIDGPTVARSFASLYEIDAATLAKLKDILTARR